MCSKKKERAISQALASLQIDNIFVSNDFVNTYRKKVNLPPLGVKKLALKRGRQNETNKRAN